MAPPVPRARASARPIVGGDAPSRALQCELALVRLLSATLSPSRVLSAQDKISQ